jgi:hypothetical protein
MYDLGKKRPRQRGRDPRLQKQKKDTARGVFRLSLRSSLPLALSQIAFWDNRITQHRPVNDYWPLHRKLQRITIDGDRPYFQS